MKRIFTLIAFLTTVAFAQAQPGFLDPSFGSGGIVVTTVIPGYNSAESVAIQNDGKIVASGYAGFPGEYAAAVVRYNDDGSMDNSFGNNGMAVISATTTSDYALGSAIQPDGKIVLGGYIFTGSSTDVLLIRLNADGTLDDTFGTAGIVITDFGASDVAEAIALQADGKILLAGDHNDKFMLLRYNTDGTLDDTFGTGGLASADVGVSVCFAKSVVVQDDGKIVAGGMGFNENSNFGFAIARFNTDGSLDNNFADNGTKLFNIGDGHDFILDLAIQSNGKIIVGGHTWIGNQPLRYDMAAVRLNQDGSIDNTFGDAGSTTVNIIAGENYLNSIALQTDDEIILCGYTTTIDDDDLVIARLTADGILDTTFGTDGITVTDVAGSPDAGNAVAIQPTGQIVAAGFTSSGGPFPEMLVARYNGDGGSVNPSVNITTGEITNITVEATFTPNDECDTYYALLSTQSEMEMWSAWLGVSIDSLVQMWGIEKTETYTHLWNEQVPNTEYTLYARPLDANGLAYPLNTITCTTLTGGGNGLAEIEVQVIEIADSSARLIATPNDQTAVFFDGLITVEYFNEIGEDSAVSYMRTNGFPQYVTDDWVWTGLTPNTDYYAIATGQNALGEWGTTTLVQFTTLTVGIDDPEEPETALHIFPMPNDGAFAFETPDGEAGTIRIFNANGQLVLEQLVSGQQAAIDARYLTNGLYHLQFTSNSKAVTVSEKLLITK